jgi:hypothetical protein
MTTGTGIATETGLVIETEKDNAMIGSETTGVGTLIVRTEGMTADALAQGNARTATVSHPLRQELWKQSLNNLLHRLLKTKK